MKIAVMADIHSNHIALEKCIEEAKRKGAEEFLFLGDYIGELAYPEKTLNILVETEKTYPCTFIRGNKEDYWIDHKKGKHKDWNWEMGKSGSGMLKYSYDRLSAEQIAWFEEMPITKVMQYKDMPAFVICHGSPFKVNESMREDYYKMSKAAAVSVKADILRNPHGDDSRRDYIDELTEKLETELTICGHFHIQSEYVRNGKRVVNPGSVGVPLKSGGNTQFMMLYDNEGRWETEFITLTYDVDSAIREMDEEKFIEKAPAWYHVTKAVLRGDNVSHRVVLSKACELFEQSEGKADWRNIPEKYWELALKEYGIK